jgi:diacylglycerol kinase
MVKHWIDKFRNAFRGLWWGIVGQSSFSVHFPMAIAVLIAAGWLGCELVESCLLLLCIGLVLSLELVNSAIEYLARGLCREQNQQVGYALDIASAAVLVSSLIAAFVGVLILGNRLLLLFG